jgi:SAM-dependent methyltransferase
MTDQLNTINEKTRQAYNLVAQKYHDLFHDELKLKEYDRNLLDRFARNFSNKSLVCDAGCGPSGHIGRFLFDKGIPVLGVDISDRCVELARRHNPELRFVQASIGEMPFADETFDGIIAYYSIIDTPKDCVGGIFREFNRVLRHKGLLLVAAKAGEREGYLTELLGLETEIYFSHFSKDEIARCFREGGFCLEFLEQRDPYSFEIKAERIFAIGRKEQQLGR